MDYIPIIKDLRDTESYCPEDILKPFFEKKECF
jgi:hypothetical protein